MPRGSGRRNPHDPVSYTHLDVYKRQAPSLAHMFGVQGTLIAAGMLVAVVPLAILVVRRRELAQLVKSERVAEEELAEG